MSEPTKFDRDKIFSQKSIWQLLRFYQRSFDRPFPALVHAAFAFFLALALFVPATYLKQDGSSLNIETDNFVVLVSLLSGAGLAAGVGLLSVAIAGFAIFASGLDGKLASRLVTRIRRQNGFPYVVFVFAFFVYTLTTLLFLVASSLVFSAASVRDGPLYLIVTDALGEYSRGFYLLVCSAQIAQLAFVISILKSFIWNLYDTLLTITATRARDQ